VTIDASNMSHVTDYIHLAANITASVLIVLVNRTLLSVRGFPYPLTLTGIHLIASGIFGRIWSKYEGTYKGFHFDQHVAKLVVYAMLSLGFLNLSLTYNTVSFYQASKLLIIPCSAFLEYLTMKSSLTMGQILSIAVSIFGVALVSVGDLNFDIHLPGLIFAASSIVSSSLQQLSARQIQVHVRMSTANLLMVVGIVSGTILTLIGPFLDGLMHGEQFVLAVPHFSPGDMGFVAITVLLAISVNLTQYTCLGKFTVVTFQVASHLKTVSVFISSWLFFGESLNSSKVIGCVITLFGIYGFSRLSTKDKVPTSPAPQNKD
jgi:solute carrier family 35 protein E3